MTPRQETHARQVACPPLVVPSGLMPDKLSPLPVGHQCYYHPGRQILAHSELNFLTHLICVLLCLSLSGIFLIRVPDVPGLDP